MDNTRALFRGKRTDNGEWVYGYVYPGIGPYKREWYITSISADFLESHTYAVDSSTLSQYTDLTDRNGKWIFEGDVVEHHVQGDILINRGVVAFERGAFFLKLNTMRPPLYTASDWALEVIGNVHDNLELMGGNDA